MTRHKMLQEWILILIAQENIEELKVFLENEGKIIDLNFKNEMSITPLMNALKTNNLEIITLLITHGANVHQLLTTNCYNLLTYLPFAHSDPSLKMITMLCDLGLKPYQDDYKNSALHFALNSGNTQLAEKFIQVGANINEIDKENTPAIYQVIKRGINNSINFLLEKKAKLDFKDEENNSLIELALQRGKLKLAQKLFDHGAPFELIDESKIPKVHLHTIYEFQSFVEKTHLEKSVNEKSISISKVKL